MRNFFLRSFRITKTKDYRKIFKEKKRIIGNLITINYRFGSSSSPKLGITASRKFGKAIIRNRFKRQIRESFRKNIAQLPQNIEINVLPRKFAENAKSLDIEKELLSLLKNSEKIS